MSRTLPLAGRRVAVTRSRDQASELGQKLAALGAEVIALPLIRISARVDRQLLADALLELGRYDWMVFTSANGVRFFFAEFFRVFDDIRALGLVRFATVGAATAQALADLHLRVECQPAEASAERLAEELIATGSLDSAQILVVKGNLNRDTLVTRLEEARGIVDQLQVYQTETNDVTGDPAAADFRRRGADAILFTSSSAAQSYADQRAGLALEPGAVPPLAGSIGAQTTATLRAAGIPLAFQAKSASLDGLVQALADRLAGS